MPNQKPTFWSISDSGSLLPEIVQLYDYLNAKGFRHKEIQKEEMELYRLNGCFVELSSSHALVKEIKRYLERNKTLSAAREIEFARKGPQLFEFNNKQILERITKYGWNKIFSEKNFNNLDPLEIDIQRGTRDRAFFYFKNGYVEITKKEIKLHSYESTQRHIYKDHIIPRPVEIIDLHDNATKLKSRNALNFLDFLERICGKDSKEQQLSMDLDNEEKTTWEEKLDVLFKMLGFALHDYKQQGLTDFCIIFCDDEGGGSGKGLLVQALEQMTTLYNKDCKKEKNFDPKKLNEFTKIKVYNDVQPGFSLDKIYNEITEGGTIEYKNGHEIILSYKDTWKVLITSNHIIKGSKEADLRRQRVFTLSPFFDSQRLVQDYYNQSFFSEDWNIDDWNYFYNLMFYAVQEWLLCDYKIDFKDKEYHARKMELYYPELREFFDELPKHTWHFSRTVFEDFQSKHGRKDHIKLNPNSFGRLLTNYFNDMGYETIKGPNRTEFRIEKRNEK